MAQDWMTTLDERSGGIGAQDGTKLHVVGTWWTATLAAGSLHTLYRREAMWLRHRAFDRIPAYATLTPAGNHTPNGATEAELRLGCPAWPGEPEDPNCPCGGYADRGHRAPCPDA